MLGYRDKDQRDVDVVIENAAGRVVGVEVKAKATVHRNDFAGSSRLADLASESFLGGFLLSDGSDTLPMGPGLWALPLSTLWQA